MAGETILVVEDDLHFGRQITDLFGFLGYAPRLVASGREALEAFSESPFDFMLSDLMLPEMNGIDVVKQVRALPGGATVPVIMMSAVYRNPKLFQRELRSLGVIEFLPKPFSIIDLGRRVGTILDGEAEKIDDSNITASGSWSSTALRTSLGEQKPDFDLTGQFDRLVLLNLFIEIFQSHQAGRLTLRRDASERVVCFLNGYPVWGQSDDPSEGLGAVIERNGELPGSQIARLNARATAEGRTLRDVLLEEAVLSERRLFLAERRRVRQVVLGCFGGAKGTYTFEPGDDFVDRVGVFEVNPVKCLAEVVQKFMDINDLAPAVHEASDRALVRGRRYRQLYPYLGVPPELKSLGADLKRGANVGQLFRAYATHSDTLIRLLWLMLRLNVAEPRSSGLPADQLAPNDEPDASHYGTGPIPVRSPPTLSEPVMRAATMDKTSRAILSDYLSLMETDFYGVLGLSRGATRGQINAAYEERMLRYSLTRLPASASSDVRAKAKELLVRLLDAFETLSDPARRAAYDKGLT